ncbi:MAG: phage tail tape measure protein [Psychrobacter alimentarius]
MADLNFKAQIELLDKMTAPMRSISSQAQRLGRQFGETAQQAKKLQGQQRLIDSFKQQKHALAETSEAAQRSRLRLADLQRQMQATANPAASLVRQFEAAGRESQRLNTRLDSQRQHLQQLRGRLADAGISTNNLSDHERELARQIERTNQQLGEQRRRMSEVRRLEQQSNQMRDMRGKATGLAVGGAAATYAGARFIQPGLDLEQNMSKVQALTRLNKNSPQYKALEQQAKQLGATTQFTSADAAAGQSFLAMAGFTPQSIKAAMPGMLDLAMAGGIELDRTADIASNILSGMKLDASQMGQVGDVLSAAFTRANLNVEMLGETMKYAAPGAAGLGVSLEEVAAMAGKLGDAGMQGSMGGTALRSIMLRLASPPKKAGDALSDLGIQVADAEGNMRKMPDLLTELYEKTKDMGNLQRTEILADIAGVEASNAMNELVSRAGSGELQKLIADLQGSQGELANLSSTMSDNTVGDFKEMTSGIDAFRTAVFDANGGALREFLQSMTAMVGRMTAFANANPQLIAVLGKLFAILAIGAVIIGGLGVVMLTILGPMALLRASLVTLGLPSTLTPLRMLWSLFGFVGKAVVSTVALIGKSLMGLFTVIKTVGAFMMANPILIAIALLATAAFLIYKNWGPISEFFINLWNSICQAWDTGINWIINTWNSATATINTILYQWIDSIKTAWRGFIGGLINGTTTLWTNIKNAFTNGVAALTTAAAQLWTFIITTFTNGVMTVVNFIRGFGAQLLIIMQSAWTMLTTAAAQLWTRIKALFSGGIGSLIATLLSFSPAGLFVRAFAAVWPYLSSLTTKFTQYGANLLSGLKNGIIGKAQSVVDGIKSVGSRIKSTFTGLLGIHSPSRVFAKYGGFIMDGLSVGIDRFARRPFNAMSKVTRFFTDQPIIKLKTAMRDIMPAPLTKAPLNIDTTALDALGTRQLTVHAKIDTDTSKLGKLWSAVKSLPLPSKLMRIVSNYSPINLDTINAAGRYIKRTGNSNDGIITQSPINLDRRRSILPNAATSSSSRGSAAMSMGSITININGAVDPNATAQMVRREMERLQRETAARYRSRLSDID